MNVINIKKGALWCALILVGLMGNQAQSATSEQPAMMGPLVLKSASSDFEITAEEESWSDASEHWLGPIINDLASPEESETLAVPLKSVPPFWHPITPIVPKGSHLAQSKPKKSLPKIAILIDDLGYNRQGMKSALALPKNVALAILPLTPFAHETATQAKAQQRVTILHAPMENVRELKLGPGGLYVKMTEKQLKTALVKDIDSLPGIKGVNNHMGSLLTAQQNSMNWVMEVLQGRSLFFIDSLTSSHSVAEKTAKRHGLKTTSRDVFLDNIRMEKAIDKQFSRLIKLAKRNGEALAIGHPYPETMAYLKKRLVALEKDGVKLVALTEMLQKTPQKP
ncbi:MAG: divergent polysaccharide deacetylase family protein [Marinomonas sp.]|uniref:divergent polysaccharide deacetylase family protein n=1 Tax=Marinomonas sp. TaxID=1904862 RepID=UPI003C71E62C